MVPNLGLVVVTAMVALSSLHARQTPNKPIDPWPPEGVFLPGGEVTPPRLLIQTQPKYAAEAMRRKTQGVVTLACVVQADGTVGAVQVRQSLGFGLDDEAIIAVKQWRFSPGMRSGVAVPVPVTLKLAFSIRGEMPPSTWPDAFVEVATTGNADAWTEDSAEGEGVAIHVAYPAGWMSRKDATPTRLVAFQHENGLRAMFVGRPRRMPAPMPQPVTVLAVQQFADRMQSTLAAGLERRAYGQGRVNDRWWVWLDLHSTTLPPGLVQVSGDAFAGMRMWVSNSPAPSFSEC